MPATYINQNVDIDRFNCSVLMGGTLYENARENRRANQEWTQNKRTKTKKKRRKKDISSDSFFR